MCVCVCKCVRACVSACVRACVCKCMRACVRACVRPRYQNVKSTCPKGYQGFRYFASPGAFSSSILQEGQRLLCAPLFILISELRKQHSGTPSKPEEEHSLRVYMFGSFLNLWRHSSHITCIILTAELPEKPEDITIHK